MQHMPHLIHTLAFSTAEMEKRTGIKLSGSVLKTLTCICGLVGIGLPGTTLAWQGLACTGQPGLWPSRNGVGGSAGMLMPAQARIPGTGPAGKRCTLAQPDYRSVLVAARC
jgi:hypothetical protein